MYELGTVTYCDVTITVTVFSTFVSPVSAANRRGVNSIGQRVIRRRLTAGRSIIVPRRANELSIQQYVRGAYRTVRVSEAILSTHSFSLKRARTRNDNSNVHRFARDAAIVFTMFGKIDGRLLKRTTERRRPCKRAYCYAPDDGNDYFPDTVGHTHCVHDRCRNRGPLGEFNRPPTTSVSYYRYPLSARKTRLFVYRNGPFKTATG